jgi:hypothetical protein
MEDKTVKVSSELNNELKNKNKKRFDISSKSFWISLVLLLLLFVGLFFGKDILNYIETEKYLKKDNITENMINDINYYKNIKTDKYVVYFYNEKECEECRDYSLEIKNYEKKSKLKVLKVDINKLGKDVVESGLFMDSRHPYIVIIKDGDEDYRYVGAYPVKQLP